MNIEARRVNLYLQVKIIEGNTTIDLGLLNEKECEPLACELIEAAYAIGPRSNGGKWFSDLLDKCGINLPDKLPLI